jgi:hypothetical protein
VRLAKRLRKVDVYDAAQLAILLVPGQRGRVAQSHFGDAEEAAFSAVLEPAGVEAGGDVANAGEDGELEREK